MNRILEAIDKDRREWAMKPVQEYTRMIDLEHGLRTVETTQIGMVRLEHYFTISLNALLANSAITGHSPNYQALVNHAWNITIEAINSLPGS